MREIIFGITLELDPMARTNQISMQSHKSKKRGFAIVMALSLLSIVFLLVISLVNLVGVDLNLSDARKKKVLAQAHARMGMMVAIGELQKHLGPDTRVSTTADILDERIESGKKFESSYYGNSLSPDLQGLVRKNQAVDLNENNQLDTVPLGQRYWTGVWKHRARRKGVADDYKAAAPLPKNLETGATMDSTPMADTEYDPHPAVEVAWLVSGNEGWSKKLAIMQGPMIAKDYLEIPDGIPVTERFLTDSAGGTYGKRQNAWEDYQQAVDDHIQEYEHPLRELPDPDPANPNNDVVWLLRRPLLEEAVEDQTEDWKSKLRGEPVKVRKTKVQPKDPDDRLHSHGSYAYWVGDEGIKAKLDIPLQSNESGNTEKQMEDLAIAKTPNILFDDSSDTNTGPSIGGHGMQFLDEETKHKTLSLGLLANDEIFDEASVQGKNSKIAAHYHSLTTHSHGVLADVRTGGLKRDLSHAFAGTKNWDASMKDAAEQSGNNWMDDFLGFIYRDRVHVLKSVPMEKDAKANQWNDTAATESINDYKGTLAGPLWRMLGSFHNLYLNITSSAVRNKVADALPRFSGDNFVLFKPPRKPDTGGNEFWRSIHPDQSLALNTRVNFLNNNARPGPKTHAIQPVLTEFKYSQVPTLSGGNLALAMYPSVALWNPYNVAIQLSQLYIEVPFRQSTLRTLSPKEYDRWRKWYMWCWVPRVPPFGNGGGGPATRFPDIPKGFPYRNGPIGLSGAAGTEGWMGRLMLSHSPNHRLGADNGRGFDVPDFTYEEFVRYGPQNFPDPVRQRTAAPGQLKSNGFVRYVKDPSLEQFERTFHFLFSNDPVKDSDGSPNERKERHLLLSIRSLSLAPGEKAHFTVSRNNNRTPWLEEPSDGDVKQYLQVQLEKGVDQHAFICETDLSIPAGEPLSVKNVIGKVQGVHTNQLTFYDYRAGREGNMLGSIAGNPEAKGITMYSANPSDSQISGNIFRSLPPNQRKPIFKITKTFDISAGYDHWHSMFNARKVLGLTTPPQGEFLPGNGIRLRYKLPGTGDRIMLEQYNLRALVQSYQDGFGDNWKMENFVGSRFDGEDFNFCQRIKNEKSGHGGPNHVPTYTVSSSDPNEPTAVFAPHRSRFVDFYEFANNGSYEENMTIDQAILPLDPLDYNYDFLENEISTTEDTISNTTFAATVVPRITSTSSSIGYFHDIDEEHGAYMDAEDNAVLFDVPVSPMLSILQLRHANLSDYSHGSSYILGNSYATSQVARYKTWGRVKSIAWIPDSVRMDISMNEKSSNLWNQAFPMLPISPWKRFVARNNLYMPSLGPVRDLDGQSEHQNTTLDHSFYANRALMDGYFMSGVGHESQSQFAPKSLTEMQADLQNLLPGEIYRPYRNPRLIPYLRNNDLSETSYGDLRNDVPDLSNEEEKNYRFQTMAADLLLEGAFNINSTSVDAWIAQLSSLRGKPIPNDGGSSFETPFPRFLNQPEENTWNKIRFLTDDEITLLAHCLIEQIKLRGPFLSFSDFTNRRLIGTPVNLIPKNISTWKSFSKESRDSVLGLRGAVQAAIAEAAINDFKTNGASTSTMVGSWPDNPKIPDIPMKRFGGQEQIAQHFLPPSEMNFLSSEFGLYAFGTQPRKPSRPADPSSVGKILTQPEYLAHTRNIDNGFDPLSEGTYVSYPSDFGLGSSRVENIFMGTRFDSASGEWIRTGNILWQGQTFAYKAGWDDYEGAASFGEAPDNMLAVENVATAANKPGWLMQSDVLSPLAPVTSARSDTFIIRVMGETGSKANSDSSGRAWIELTVQRTPDYVKSNLDAPHHRPHEPFEDRNFNGYWDDDPSFVEHWLDLNQDGMDEKGEQTLPDARPNLSSVGIYPDGLGSDLPLNEDIEEENLNIDPQQGYTDGKDVVSRMGINQRFGRKFKIIKFRWIRKQDV